MTKLLLTEQYNSSNVFKKKDKQGKHWRCAVALSWNHEVFSLKLHDFKLAKVQCTVDDLINWFNINLCKIQRKIDFFF